MFIQTFWRDWLPPDLLSKLDDRQRKAVLEVKTRVRIGNTEYHQLTGKTNKTATRDLEDLVKKGILAKAGTTGRGNHYVLAQKGDIKGTKGTPNLARPAKPNGDKMGPKET